MHNDQRICSVWFAHSSILWSNVCVVQWHDERWCKTTINHQRYHKQSIHNNRILSWLLPIWRMIRAWRTSNTEMWSKWDKMHVKKEHLRSKYIILLKLIKTKTWCTSEEICLQSNLIEIVFIHVKFELFYYYLDLLFAFEKYRHQTDEHEHSDNNTRWRNGLIQLQYNFW